MMNATVNQPSCPSTDSEREWVDVDEYQARALRSSNSTNQSILSKSQQLRSLLDPNSASEWLSTVVAHPSEKGSHLHRAASTSLLNSIQSQHDLHQSATFNRMTMSWPCPEMDATRASNAIDLDSESSNAPEPTNQAVPPHARLVSRKVERLQPAQSSCQQPATCPLVYGSQNLNNILNSSRKSSYDSVLDGSNSYMTKSIIEKAQHLGPNENRYNPLIRRSSSSFQERDSALGTLSNALLSPFEDLPSSQDSTLHPLDELSKDASLFFESRPSDVPGNKLTDVLAPSDTDDELYSMDITHDAFSELLNSRIPSSSCQDNSYHSNDEIIQVPRAGALLQTMGHRPQHFDERDTSYELSPTIPATMADQNHVEPFWDGILGNQVNDPLHPRASSQDDQSIQVCDDSQEQVHTQVNHRNASRNSPLDDYYNSEQQIARSRESHSSNAANHGSPQWLHARSVSRSSSSTSASRMLGIKRSGVPRRRLLRVGRPPSTIHQAISQDSSKSCKDPSPSLVESNPNPPLKSTSQQPGKIWLKRLAWASVWVITIASCIMYAMHASSVAWECYESMGHLSWQMSDAPLLSGPLVALNIHSFSVRVPQLICKSELNSVYPVINVASQLANALVVEQPPAGLLELYDTIESVAFDLTGLYRTYKRGTRRKIKDDPHVSLDDLVFGLFDNPEILKMPETYRAEDGRATTKGVKTVRLDSFESLSTGLLNVVDSLRTGEKSVIILRSKMKAASGRVARAFQSLEGILGDERPSRKWAQIVSLIFPDPISSDFEKRCEAFRHLLLGETQQLRAALMDTELAVRTAEDEVSAALNMLNLGLMRIQSLSEVKSTTRLTSSKMTRTTPSSSLSTNMPVTTTVDPSFFGKFMSLFTLDESDHMNSPSSTITAQTIASPTPKQEMPDPFDVTMEVTQNSRDHPRVKQIVELLTIAESNIKEARKSLRSLFQFVAEAEAFLNNARDHAFGRTDQQNSASVWGNSKRSILHAHVSDIQNRLQASGRKEGRLLVDG